MDFARDGECYTATGPGGRRWQIDSERTGWRLSFRDSGDLTSTNAGVHRSAEAAMAEAGRQHRRRG